MFWTSRQIVQFCALAVAETRYDSGYKERRGTVDKGRILR